LAASARRWLRAAISTRKRAAAVAFQRGHERVRPQGPPPRPFARQIVVLAEILVEVRPPVGVAFEPGAAVDDNVGRSYIAPARSGAGELTMATAQRHENGSGSRRVLVSNTAANMISSLHPFDKSKADAVLARVKSSVLDSSKVKEIVGVDNAFVARAGDLRVVFRNEGNSVVITSVVAQA
jgi:hypothetical protein